MTCLLTKIMKLLHSVKESSNIRCNILSIKHVLNIIKDYYILKRRKYFLEDSFCEHLLMLFVPPTIIG